MRILYAAGNRPGSFYQLKRFIDSIKNLNYELKIAAYKISAGELDIDYNLDSLLNFTNPNSTISFNGNYSYYNNEIKRFNPDLIISDFELYSSILANDLGIKLWQVSPVNLYYAITPEIKQKIGVHKNYSHLIESNHKKSNYISYILNNSDRKFVLSHLCDCENVPSLISGYEWARPSFVLGDGANKFQYMVASAKSNKKIIDELKEKKSALFSQSTHEKYDRMIVDSIDSDLYKTSLENSKSFITDGTAIFLADAFYNQKYAYCIPRYDDMETIICSYMNEFCGVGRIGAQDQSSSIKIKINENVKFISEYLGEL